MLYIRVRASLSDIELQNQQRMRSLWLCCFIYSLHYLLNNVFHLIIAYPLICVFPHMIACPLIFVCSFDQCVSSDNCVSSNQCISFVYVVYSKKNYFYFYLLIMLFPCFFPSDYVLGYGMYLFVLFFCTLNLEH